MSQKIMTTASEEKAKKDRFEEEILSISDEEAASATASSQSKRRKRNRRKGSSEHTEEDDEDGSKNNEEKSSTPPPPPPLSKLLKLSRPELFGLLFALLLMILSEAVGLINPVLLADAYNVLVDPANDGDSNAIMSSINRTMILVIILHVAGVFGAFVRTAVMNAAGERIVARLRVQLYDSILKQEIAFFDDNRVGDLVSRLGSDTTLIQQGTSLAVPEVVLGLVKLSVSIGLMFWLSPKLAAVTLGMTLMIFLVVAPFGSIVGKLSRSYQQLLGEAQTRSTEALGSVKTVQAFAAEDRERNYYREKIGDPDLTQRCWWCLFFPSSFSSRANNAADGSPTTYSAGLAKSYWTAGFFSILFGFGFGSMFLSLWYGFKLVAEDEMTLGDLTAFQSYIFQIGGSLGTTSRYVTQLIEARGASGRVFELLERLPAIPSPLPPPPVPATKFGDGNEQGKTTTVPTPTTSVVPLQNPLTPSSMTGRVQFQDVSFSYPSRPDIPVLRNFTLTVPETTTAALVGASGSGKSTVVSLLQRFYDVDGGSVSIDGHDIRTLDLQWMRRHIGYVQQEPQLFGLTVRDNVCYGVSREVTDEEVETVCREANAHDFISQWPKGYHTLVGERGVKLSGGQKQRIAIARALLVNPRILLLDEATSALDAESEHLVQEAIDKVVVGRTVLIVAHRLSTIKDASQIVVLDNHQIVDVGTHEVLLGRCVKYQELIKRQTAQKEPS